MTHTPAAFEIRNGCARDAAAIADIYNQGIRERTSTFETRERTAAEVEAWFAGAAYPIMVATRADRVIAWIAASQYRARECYRGIAEYSVYVDERARGSGVGSALLAAFLPVLEQAGYWKVLSRIFPENAASRALCRRHGFREVGIYERHAQLDGAWRDVLIVERLLGGARSDEAAARRSAV